MAKLIGTVGHVDHGKTRLIEALTGINADRLPEERDRGMTIEIGFAYIDLPEVGRVSIVDVPGHERFLSNMLVGALGVDVALLCIAADAGVMPQTREHFQVLTLLPVERLIVVLTRSDLVETDFLELMRSEASAFLSGTRFEGSPVVAVSAVTGEGLDDLRSELTTIFTAHQSERQGPWYLPIDRVFSKVGQGVIVTGTVMQGQVRVGETAMLQPSGLEAKVRGMQRHDSNSETAEYGMRVALQLGGAKVTEVERGMVIGAPGATFATRCFDGVLTQVGDLKHGQRVRVHIGSDEVIARAFLSDASPEIVQFRLERQSAAAIDQPFIVRNYSPPELLGGGKVAVPVARSRRKCEIGTTASGGSDVERILDIVGRQPAGVLNEELCRLLGRTPQQLGDALEKLKSTGALRSFAGLWLDSAGYVKTSEQLGDALAKLHAAHPTRGGHPKEVVARAAGLKIDGKPLNRLFAELAEQGLIRIQGADVALADYKLQLTPRQDELLARVESHLDQSGLAVPSLEDISKALVVPRQAVEEITRIGLEAQRLVRISPDLWYTNAQIAKVISVVKGLPQPFAANEFRDATGTSRRYAIPLLEHLDSIGTTTRKGDVRYVNKDSN